MIHKLLVHNFKLKKFYTRMQGASKIVRTFQVCANNRMRLGRSREGVGMIG